VDAFPPSTDQIGCRQSRRQPRAHRV